MPTIVFDKQVTRRGVIYPPHQKFDITDAEVDNAVRAGGTLVMNRADEQQDVGFGMGMPMGDVEPMQDVMGASTDDPKGEEPKQPEEQNGNETSNTPEKEPEAEQPAPEPEKEPEPAAEKPKAAPKKGLADIKKPTAKK